MTLKFGASKELEGELPQSVLAAVESGQRFSPLALHFFGIEARVEQCL